jgi:hypothetical protein
VAAGSRTRALYPNSTTGTATPAIAVDRRAGPAGFGGPLHGSRRAGVTAMWPRPHLKVRSIPQRPLQGLIQASRCQLIGKFGLKGRQLLRHGTSPAETAIRPGEPIFRIRQVAFLNVKDPVKPGTERRTVPLRQVVRIGPPSGSQMSQGLAQRVVCHVVTAPWLPASRRVLSDDPPPSTRPR